MYCPNCNSLKHVDKFSLKKIRDGHENRVASQTTPTFRSPVQISNSLPLQERLAIIRASSSVAASNFLTAMNCPYLPTV
jgi:hypothetical protein